MSLPAECEGCFHQFAVPEKYAGKRVRCPACGGGVAVSGGGRTGVAPRTAPPLPGRSLPGRTLPARSRRPAAGGTKKVPLAVGGVAAAVLLTLGVSLGLLLGRGGDSPAVLPAAGTMPESRFDPDRVPDAERSPAVIATSAPAESLSAEPEAVPTAPAAITYTRPADVPVAPTAVSLSPSASASRSETIAAGSPSAVTAPVAAAVGDAAGRPALRTETRELADLIELVEPSVVRVNAVAADGFGHGSGFVADRFGNVVTNYHVIAGAKKVTVEFSDGREVVSKGYRLIDPARDMAVLALDLPADTVPALPVAAALPRKGETVVGFGSPQGLNFTTSQGIVSAIRSEQEMHDLLGAGAVKGTWLRQPRRSAPAAAAARCATGPATWWQSIR